MSLINPDNIETVALSILALERMYQKILNERAKRQNYLPHVSKNAKLITQLDELRKDIGADRVLLFKMHNGGKYSDGESIRKVSVTQDRHEPEIGSVSQLFQNVLIDNIPNLLIKLGYEDQLEYIQTEATEQTERGEGTAKKANDLLFSQFLDLANVSHFYAMRLTKKGRTIGFMAVVTNHPNKPITANDKTRTAEVLQRIKTLI